MPAETAHHERTLMAWPTIAMAECELWGDAGLDGARAVYAEIAGTIARYEPVTMVAAPAEAASAAQCCGAGVDVVALPIDDSWIRDTGPIVVLDGAERRALHFRFNAWGEKWLSYAADAAVGREIAAALGFPVLEVPMVLEGGSIAVDGEGLLVTTERCLLNPNRNPAMSKAAIEATLRKHLGVDRFVWLADAIAEDDGTDGHVDNVVAFTRPGRVLLQGCDDPANANHAVALDNRRRLIEAGIEVVDVPVLPYGRVGTSPPLAVPYVNLYALNGAVLVPTCGADADDAMLELIADEYPAREVVAVPGAILARGGGGVHCITQQVPAR
jgi:agmatine deiminase